jgi:hypothetical protein
LARIDNNSHFIGFSIRSLRLPKGQPVALFSFLPSLPYLQHEFLSGRSTGRDIHPLKEEMELPMYMESVRKTAECVAAA